MDKLQASGVMIRDPQPCYYDYRIIWGDHVQTGLVAAASVAAYQANRIRKHEHTQPVKEEGRVKQIEAVNAQTGPVMLAYGAAPKIDALLAECAARDPDMDVAAEHDVRHLLWVVSDRQMIDRLTDAFEQQPVLYVADGHHRIAAAARVCGNRSQGGKADEAASYARILTVSFPHHETSILDYNRLIKDLNGLTPEELVARIGEKFSVEPAGKPVKPAALREFGMYCAGQWYRLHAPDTLAPKNDPVGRLDVSILSDHVIAPLLDIPDQRRNPRISFIGGIRGVEELQARVDAGKGAVAFSFYPTSMEDLMAVADAGLVMPTKSTWFEPKLADGMVSHILD
jgi:uncharacterized protein (DUF1015 family)